MGGAFAGMMRQCLFFIFFAHAMVPSRDLVPYANRHTLHISIVNIAQTGPQGHFSVGPQRGSGSSPPGPPFVHATAGDHRGPKPLQIT